MKYSLTKLGLLLLALYSAHPFAAEDTDEELTVNASTTDVEGLSEQDISEEHKLADIFTLQKDLVYRLLQNIGISKDKLSADVKKAIDKPHTTSLKAFKAFSNCLDLMDKQLFAEARQQCDEAVKYDPNFALAQGLRESIPDHEENMAQIVDDHMNNPEKPSENNDVSTGGNNYDSTDKVKTIEAINCEKNGGCLTDKSTPACNDKGQCGFYSTFLVRTTGGRTEISQPFMTRTAVSIPTDHREGNISINQIGYEGKGNLNVHIDSDNVNSKVTGFHDGQFNQGIANIPATENNQNQLDRIVTDQFPSKGESTQNAKIIGDTGTGITGLELGMYFTGFDANGRLGKVGNSLYDLAHGALYYAEGLATPADRIKDLQTVTYSGEVGTVNGVNHGAINADFSVNGQLIACQDCGHFTSTLNYAAGRLENFELNANARQPEGNLTVSTHIFAENLPLNPATGAFQFNQASGPGVNFEIGTNSEHLAPATGNVAAGPFGPNAELLGGVFAIQGNGIQGHGNFGGTQVETQVPLR